jgi:hypothetical protein
MILYFHKTAVVAIRRKDDALPGFDHG